MFSLFYGLFEYLLRKAEYHILILGIHKAGKTTLLEKIKATYTGLPGLEPDSILPTVGLNVGRMEAHNAQLIFWDLGGAPGLRSIWDKYYADSHAIVYVIDASMPDWFDEAKDALESILGHRDLFGAPLLVFANKQDTDHVETNESVTEHLGLGKFHSRPCRVQSVSALTGDGIREGLKWLIEEIKHSQRASLLRQRGAS